MISIETVPLGYVLENDEKKLNTNNHWIDGKKPNDYHEVIAENYTKNWIDLFHQSYKTIILYRMDIMWMYEAFNIGRQTQQFSPIYEEDMIDFLERYRDETNSIFDGTKYFIRTDTVSLKNGIHKVGPYTNLRDIIDESDLSLPPLIIFTDFKFLSDSSNLFFTSVDESLTIITDISSFKPSTSASIFDKSI